MSKKFMKKVIIIVVSLCIIGTFVFGRDFISYVRSSTKMARNVVKDAVPIEFELRRASDLLEEIIPEIHANIRLMAQEEVEIAALKTEIANQKTALAEEQQAIDTLRKKLDQDKDKYTFGDREFSRSRLIEDLSLRFDRYKEGEMVLEGKKRLLATREQSLDSAKKLLEKTRSQKRILASKIKSLESQHRLIQAAAVGTSIKVDNSKLHQTEKLIKSIKKRLDVAERVLAHESQFVQTIPIDIVSEEDLLSQIDEYFSPEEEAIEDN